MSSDALTVQVERRIYLIRGEKVMLDCDLASWRFGWCHQFANRVEDDFELSIVFLL